jgi:protoporphyrinogen oxidase
MVLWGQNKSVVIIGAGPAGLTAAYELMKSRVPAIILEAGQQVGGIARTINYKGYLFDIGGHRFFTKWDEVSHIWREVLGDEFLLRPRLSRIFYRKKFFNYPLSAINALRGLGPMESARILASYLYSSLFPTAKEDNLEEWVCNRFGKRLYRIFFKTYTEKVWGVPCTSIQAEWAAQRIRGLSLKTAVYNALFPGRKSKPKSLIEQFYYPERGPGQLWDTLAEQLRRAGYLALMRHPVVRILHDDGRVTRAIARGPQGDTVFEGTHFVSSMPLRDLIHALDPAPPEAILKAANSLRYRDFLIVSLIVNRRDVVPDNWIYVHEPGVKVARIQNFKNWSSAMVPDRCKTCLGMEYFVFDNDPIWSSPDTDLLALARREIVELGLVRAEEIEDGSVVRMPKAYPMYDTGWARHVDTIKAYLQTNLSNLQSVGRNGMHKYNNQDHSMMTALCAARNICGAAHDLWAINTEADYHEESKERPSGEYPRPAYAEPPRL